MADSTTNISLTKPEATDTTYIREDFNDNMDIIDGRFSATYMAVQAKNAVTITGGSITGITDLAVADGGTGSSTATAARAALGLAIGTNVQAYDAGLLSIAALTTAANKMIYTTASDTYTTTTLSAFAITLIDDANAAAALTTLGAAAIAQTMYIGTTSVAINRSSAALTLAGITLTTPDIGTPTAGVLTNCTFPTLNQNTTGTAALATTFTCTDNESEALACLVVFVDGATDAQGAETDGDFTYTPSTGTVAATSYSGDGTNLTGVGAAAATALTISCKAAENISKGQVVYISGAVSYTHLTLPTTPYV